MSFDLVSKDGGEFKLPDGRTFSPPDDHIKRFTLEKYAYYVAHRLHEHELEKLGFDFRLHAEKIADQMVIQLRALVWGECQEPIVVKHSTPSTWWEHFKRDVLKCKRVKMREEKTVVDLAVVYPRMKVSVPDEQSALYMAKRTSVREMWRKV